MHEALREGRERECGEIFQKWLGKDGNYFKGCGCSAEKQFPVMRLISEALNGV